MYDERVFAIYNKDVCLIKNVCLVDTVEFICEAIQKSSTIYRRKEGWAPRLKWTIM